MQQTISETAPAPETVTRGKRTGGRRGGVRKVLILFLVLAVLTGGVLWYLQRRGAAAEGAGTLNYRTARAEKGSITMSLSGSGTLEPADAYTVMTLVEGEVLSDAFEEGDTVTADTVLYTIDSANESTFLEKAQLSLDQAQSAYDKALDSLSKLHVSCRKGGTVVSLQVEAGDDVTAGQPIATIRNSDVMTLCLPFASDDAKDFGIGTYAAVTLDSSFETLSGTVRKISAVDEVTSAGQLTREVTIEVQNPGALSPSRLATARIGDAESASSGMFAYQAEETVLAETSGTVSSLLVSEGDHVSEGQLLATLISDSLQENVDNAYQNLRNAQLSYDSQTDTLDNYTISSPIDGTVIDKYCKTGDKVSTGKTMCLIYDLSYLKTSLSIDELDVSKVAVGQTAVVTADAAEGRTYEGVVTKVSVAGTTSGGVTTYPVTVRIDGTEGLLPGMNVDVEILVDSVSDVIVIPNQAVERGNRVLVTADSPSAVNASGDGAPEGYAYVEIETGLSDDRSVAVLDGLQEGDTVAYAAAETGGDDSGGRFGMFGGAGGGMPGGAAAPGGGYQFSSRDSGDGSQVYVPNGGMPGGNG